MNRGVCNKIYLHVAGDEAKVRVVWGLPAHRKDDVAHPRLGIGILIKIRGVFLMGLATKISKEFPRVGFFPPE